ncbi:hypothetical protein J3R83DRAFT_3721 [Lanmaoa asiatica]|nr:hypothetical protein J3R83DRAFT_3721 [Lanmaoa asiatica]
MSESTPPRLDHSNTYHEGVNLADGGLGSTLEDILNFKIAHTPLWSTRAAADEGEIPITCSSPLVVPARRSKDVIDIYREGHSREQALRIMSNAVSIAARARALFCAENEGVPQNEIRIVLSLGTYGSTVSPMQDFDGIFPPPYGPKAYLATEENTTSFGDDMEGREKSIRALTEFHTERLLAYAQIPDTWVLVDGLAFETVPVAREHMKPWWLTAVFPDGRCPETRVPGGEHVPATEVAELMVHEGMDGQGRTLAIPNGIGFNCVAVEHLHGLLDQFKEACARVIGEGRKWPWLVIKPNGGGAGIGWADSVVKCVDASGQEWGSLIVGGCCKAGPDDIAQLASKLKRWEDRGSRADSEEGVLTEDYDEPDPEKTVNVARDDAQVQNAANGRIAWTGDVGWSACSIMSSKLPSILSATDEEIQLLLAAQCHIGTKNCDKQMEPYVFKRRVDGIHVINIGKTWEKLVFAARVIAAVENPNDVCVISARPYGHRAVLKFAANTGAQAIAGRFTPGSFTNYITRSFKEPRLIVVTDPRVDHQAIREASYVNIPVIALCDTDAPLKFVDVAIPTNNKTRHSIGCVGPFPATPDGWNVMVDMFFYRDPEEVERQQQEEAQAKLAATEPEGQAGLSEWDVTSAPQAGSINPALVSGDGGALDWAADPAPATDWAAEPASSWGQEPGRQWMGLSLLPSSYLGARARALILGGG